MLTFADLEALPKLRHLPCTGHLDTGERVVVSFGPEHAALEQVEFDSLLVFQDQQEIPRSDLARLTNIGGEMVASLNAESDLERKLTRKMGGAEHP